MVTAIAASADAPAPPTIALPVMKSTRTPPAVAIASANARTVILAAPLNRERPIGDDRGGGAGAWERDRGMERGDRDRGDRRRDARRGDDGDRRRDRDFHGGGARVDRGGHADRDEFAMQRGARKKSLSPPPKKKEPTPDLTDVVPILDRKRRLTQWDIKPPGYENVTAEQAKLSGEKSATSSE